MKRIILFITIINIFTNSLYSYINTINSSLIEEDKFYLSGGVKEFYKKEYGSVFILPFQLNLGLARRVEFLGKFPYIQLRRNDKSEIDTFGDIIIDLKFDMGIKYFHYPSFITKNYVYNQFIFLLGFNTATGPSEEENKSFKPFSYGLPEVRLGFLYSQYIDNFSFDYNLIYVLVQHQGEDFLPFRDKIWDSKNKIYLFNIPQILIRLFWPGKDPFAPSDTKFKWQKYPHIDDYFLMNFGWNYYFEPEFLYFSYDIFFEINWKQNWSEECFYSTLLLYSFGINVYINDTTSITGGISNFLKKKVETSFDNVYLLSINFNL